MDSEPSNDDTGSGLRARLPRPSIPQFGLFSLRVFLAALLLGLGAMAVGTLVPLPGARFVLLFLAMFVYGVVGPAARYLECGAAGAVAAGAGFVLAVLFDGALFPVLAGYGPELAGVGVTAGATVALAGHYFGRDLRAGWVD
jgi:hypothetical protein